MSSAMIYILAAIFIGLLGYLFFNIFSMANQMQNLTVESAVMRPMFGNINTLFIFIIPLLAMKLFSEEKKQGTMNLLLLSPLSDQQIIASKVLAGTTLILFFFGPYFNLSNNAFLQRLPKSGEPGHQLWGGNSPWHVLYDVQLLYVLSHKKLCFGRHFGNVWHFTFCFLFMDGPNFSEFFDFPTL